MIQVLTSDYSQHILRLISSSHLSIDVLSYVVNFNISKRSDRSNLIFSALTKFQLEKGLVRFLLDFPKLHKSNYHSNKFASRRFKESGFHVRFLHSGSTQHAKLFIFDGNIAVTGSHNLTPSSVINPYDISLLLDKPSLVKFFIIYFNNLWSKGVVL